ncbi:MAG TPA: hypothetical protein DDZ88_12125, partial [Verrucomicrobiales bacterium]|nr:hypothetical protein [Verrucomicrobiales bacterium]
GSGVTSGSGRLDPVQLVWPDRDHLVIFAPNWERVLSELKMENPSCVIISGEWSPPAGLTPISEARYRLLEAQAAVKREELTVA